MMRRLTRSTPTACRPKLVGILVGDYCLDAESLVLSILYIYASEHHLLKSYCIWGGFANHIQTSRWNIAVGLTKSHGPLTCQQCALVPIRRTSDPSASSECPSPGPVTVMLISVRRCHENIDRDMQHRNADGRRCVPARNCAFVIKDGCWLG